MSRRAIEESIEAFTVQAERVSAVVHSCQNAHEVGEIVRTLAGVGTVGVSRSLVERYPDVAMHLRHTFQLIHAETAADAARIAVGVGVGEALVIETGSVLVSEYRLEDRLVSMLSPILVQVVPSTALFTSLDEVAGWLETRHETGVAQYHALVTGPSRSADIERSLTIGVQGPAELHIAILDPNGTPRGSA